MAHWAVKIAKIVNGKNAKTHGLSEEAVLENPNLHPRTKPSQLEIEYFNKRFVENIERQSIGDTLMAMGTAITPHLNAVMGTIN